MKKIKKTVIVLCFILSAFSLTSYASNIDEYYKDGLEASGAKELSDYLDDETSAYLKKIGCEDLELEKLLDLSAESLFSLIFELLKKGVNAPLKGFMSACGMVILIGICSVFFSDNEKNGILLSLIGGCVLISGIFIAASDALKAGIAAMEACGAFEKALIPVLVGITAAGGNPTVALTYKGAAFAAAEFVSSFTRNFAMPLVGISGIIGMLGAVMPTVRLSAISEMIRRTLTVLLTSVASLFTGFLALKNMLSESADRLAVKGVKLVSSTFIPVVGGALGDAYSSVMGSFGLMKNTVGFYAITAFSIICIPSIISLALWSLAMRGAGILSDLLNCRSCSDILKNAAFVFSMLNAMILLCLAVFVISTGLIVAVKTGE